MSMIEMIVISAFGLFMLLFVALLINAIHFYCVYYDRLSEKIDGQIFDGGFLFAASRFLLWGHFCLSDKKAEKSGVKEVFSELPKSARRQLLFHWFGMMYGGLVLVASGILMALE